MTPATPVPNAPLTALQAETLRLIDDGKVEQKNYGNGAWRTAGASPTVVGRLISMGLAKWPTQGMGGVAVLTAAGAAYRLASPAPASSEGGGQSIIDGLKQVLSGDYTPIDVRSYSLPKPAPAALDGTATGLEVVGRFERLSTDLWVQSTGQTGTALTDHAEASRQLAEANARVAELEAEVSLIASQANRLNDAKNVAEADAARVREEGERVGKWLSAALDDPNVCEDMKDDVRLWFATFPVLPVAEVLK